MEYLILNRDYKKLVSSPTAILTQDEPQFLVFTAKKNRLELQTGFSGVYLKVSQPANVIKEGEFSADLEFIQKVSFTGEKIEFSLAGEQLSFKAGRFKGKMSVHQPDKVTTTPINKIKESKMIKMKAQDIINGLELLSLSAKIENPDMMIKVVIKKGIIEMTTSGFYCAAQYLAKSKGKLSFITRRDLFKNVVKMAKSASKEIMIGANDKQIRILTDTTDCYIPTIQKEVADVKTFLNEAKTTKTLASFKVKADKARIAIETTSSILQASGIDDVRIDAEMIDKKIKLVSKGSVGEGRNEFKVKSGKVRGKALKWQWSSSLVLSFLKLLSSDIVDCRIYDKFMVMRSGKVIYILPQVK